METPKLLFTTSQLAQLANAAQRRVERLLESENIFLDGIALRPGQKKHRRYSVLDGFRVELTLALNEHGIVPGKVASGLTERIVNPYEFLDNPEIPLTEKLEIIFNTLQATSTHVWFDEQQEKWVHASYCDRRDGSREFFGTPEAARQMAENSRDVYIFLNIARMTRNYLERLDKLLQEQGVSE